MGYWPRAQWPEITADKLLHRVNSDNPPLQIDIRSPEEYNGTDETVTYGHIPGPISIAKLDLETKTEELQQYKDKETVTMYPGGGLSLVAVDILTKAGFTDAKSLNGGTDHWHKKGTPLSPNDPHPINQTTCFSGYHQSPRQVHGQPPH